MKNPASILAAIYVASELGINLLRRADSDNARLADRGSLYLLWIVITSSVYLAFKLDVAMPEFGLESLSAPARALGVILLIAGLAIRWYAIIYLGRFFTVNVAIASDHKLVDGGPYRRVRHPSYTGALMAFLGLGLCLGNWLAIFALTVPIYLVFLRRMRVEEAALLQGLGTPYQSYMQRTKRLIPGVY